MNPDLNDAWKNFIAQGRALRIQSTPPVVRTIDAGNQDRSQGVWLFPKQDDTTKDYVFQILKSRPTRIPEFELHLPNDCYKGTIKLQTTSARIEKMSKRRRKIAMARRPSTVLTGVYPTSVKQVSQGPEDRTIELEVSFDYEVYRG